MSVRARLQRRGASERGAALVEFALFSPILVGLILGIFEYGNAWRQTGSIERAVQQGARTVSAQADNRFADYEALRAIDTATRGLPGIVVERVVIYRATLGDGAVPPNCLEASQAGLCNRYTGAQVRTINPSGFPATGVVNATCAGGSWDLAWCPTTRPRSEGNLIQLGVHLTVSYEPVTGLIPLPGLTIERSAVYQIEPCAQGQSTC
jgi:hypothetical protein